MPVSTAPTHDSRYILRTTDFSTLIRLLAPAWKCGPAWDRKLRLWGAACVRDHINILPERLRPQIDLAEQVGQAAFTPPLRILHMANWRANPVTHQDIWPPRGQESNVLHALEFLFCRFQATARLAEIPRYLARRPYVPGDRSVRVRKQCREWFWCCVGVGEALPDHVRLDSTVRALAEGIEADRAYDRLPILADAIQEAGLDGHPILDHCRAGSAHCPGCNVLDAILRPEMACWYTGR